MDLCADGRSFYVGIMEYVWDGVVYDFIDNEEFFSSGDPYTNLIDDIPKYCYFAKAALAALNYMDRAATGITVEMITGDVNAFLRNLIGQGAIVEGECTWDETKNPAVEIAQGRLTFTLSVRYAPSLESLTFEEVVEL